MSNLVKRFTSNAGANIIGGIGTAIYNLILPSIVVHRLNPEDFSIWSLGIQVIIYIQVLGFGIQTAIARFVSADNEISNKVGIFSTVVAGKKILRILMFLGVIISVLLMMVYPLFFNGLSHDGVTVLRHCILAFGLSSSLQLLSLLPIGFFTGLHKNYIHVLAQLFGRIISIIIIYLLVKAEASITVLSVGLSVGLIIPCGLLVYIMNKSQLFTTEIIMETQIYDRGKELISYCKVLAVWVFCMLFVNGIQPTIAGFFDIKHVGHYSLAMTLVMVMVGLQQAIMAPIVTVGATLHASQKNRELFRMLKLSTVMCFFVLFFSVIFFVICGRYIVKVWLGNDYVMYVYPILIALVTTNAIRNILSPYSLLLIATGAHKNAHVPAMIEAVCAVLFMSISGCLYGALGVAQGSILASIAGVCANLWVTLKQVDFIKKSERSIVLLIIFVALILIISCYAVFLSVINR